MRFLWRVPQVKNTTQGQCHIIHTRREHHCKLTGILLGKLHQVQVASSTRVASLHWVQLLSGGRVPSYYLEWTKVPGLFSITDFMAEMTQIVRRI